MARVKLTKNELKQQKDALKRFQRYLPTLQLKKQQLQLVIRQVEAQMREKSQEQEKLQRLVMSWVEVFGEDVNLQSYLRIASLRTGDGNIAGVDIPVFDGIDFEEKPYDLYTMPLWVDRGLEAVKRLLALDAEVRVLKEQHRRLSDELRITTQRVNLFEKVKIPETRDNIRAIRIYLGDQQTAAVVRGKIAKSAIDKKNGAQARSA
ncbi:MAG: V-type ATP synthase subunit D [Spirochaetaceae bacterium]|nr:MAG: V-type ATP synthase subunit D [Spirochaetaceae bacterium]